MIRLALVVTVLLVTCGAQAGGNPEVVAYIDFDPPNRVHEYYTSVPYEMFSAWLCVGDLGDGMRCLSFAFGEFDGLDGWIGFHNLLPGGSLECDAGSPMHGCTWCSSSCQPGPDVRVVRLDIVHGGGPFCIEIVDHAWYPRRVRDCDDPAGFDDYCVLAHGSVDGAVCPEGDCGTPVEDGTWGTIKSLYR